MDTAVSEVLRGKRLLLLVAAPAEARAVCEGVGIQRDIPEWEVVELSSRLDLVRTGVGKACAAGAAARTIDVERHGAVLSVGIAGSYGEAALGAVVAADKSVLADEGVQTPEAFLDLAALGFPPVAGGIAVDADATLLRALRPHADHVGTIATVSTCSGTDALAASLAARTGATAEAMEGAAVGLVATRLGVLFGELRVISNTTGDRGRQVWQIKAALAALSRVIGTLLGPNDSSRA